MLVWLALSNVGSGITVVALLKDSSNSDEVCQAYGFFSVFFLVAGAFWTVCISHTLSVVLVNRGNLMELASQLHTKELRQRRMVAYHSISWGCAFICAIIPSATGSFGITDNNWCWYKGTASQIWDDSAKMEIFSYYTPLVLSLGYCVALLIRVFMTEHHIHLDALTAQILELMHGLKFYPLILIATEGWDIIVQIVTIAYPNKDLFVLWLICVILLQLQGFLNFLAYGRREVVREAWCKSFVYANFCIQSMICPRAAIADPLLNDQLSQPGWLRWMMCLPAEPSKSPCGEQTDEEAHSKDDASDRTYRSRSLSSEQGERTDSDGNISQSFAKDEGIVMYAFLVSWCLLLRYDCDRICDHYVVSKCLCWCMYRKLTLAMKIEQEELRKKGLDHDDVLNMRYGQTDSFDAPNPPL